MKMHKLSHKMHETDTHTDKKKSHASLKLDQMHDFQSVVFI